MRFEKYNVKCVRDSAETYKVTEPRYRAPWLLALS